MTATYRIGLIGLGAIGRDLLARIGAGALGAVTCAGILVRRARLAGLVASRRSDGGAR